MSEEVTTPAEDPATGTVARVDGESINVEELRQEVNNWMTSATEASRAETAKAVKLCEELRSEIIKLKELNKSTTGLDQEAFDKMSARLGEIETGQKEFLASHGALSQLNTQLEEAQKKVEVQAAIQDAVLNKQLDRAITLQLPREQEDKVVNLFMQHVSATLRSGAEFPDEVKIANDEQLKAAIKTSRVYNATEATGVQQPAGGYFVLPEISNVVENTLRQMGAMYRIATTEMIETDSKWYRTRIEHTSGGWVGKGQDRPKTDVPTYDRNEIPAHKLYALPTIEQDYLEDASINVVAEIITDLTETFQILESQAFISGSGENEPMGFLTHEKTAAAKAKHTDVNWGKIAWTPSGKNNDIGPDASATKSKADGIIALYHAMDARYRSGAVFMMNNETLMKFRQTVDAEGRLIYGPTDINAGRGEILYGKPVVVDDFMPAVANGAFPVAFIAPRAYYIVQRRGMRMIRDEYANYEELRLYTTRRCGGDVRFFPRIVLMKASNA